MMKKVFLPTVISGVVFLTACMPPQNYQQRENIWNRSIEANLYAKKVIARYQKTLKTPCFKTVGDLLKWSAMLGNREASQLLEEEPKECLDIPLSRTDAGFYSNSLAKKEEVCFGGIKFNVDEYGGREELAKYLLEKAKGILKNYLCY